jgi:hypothetical protein
VLKTTKTNTRKYFGCNFSSFDTSFVVMHWLQNLQWYTESENIPVLVFLDSSFPWLLTDIVPSALFFPSKFSLLP